MTKSMDEAVQSAWEQYQSALESRLAIVTDEDLIFGVPRADDEAVFIAVDCVDTGELRAQLVMSPGARSELLDDAWEAIQLLGWELETRTSEELATRASSHGGEIDLAALICSTMRSVFSVPGPEFIEEDELGGDHACPAHGTSGGCDVIVDAISDSDQLRALVRDSLQCHFGRVIEPDDDGDFPVRYGSAVVWVRVESDSPVIHLFSHAVSGVRKRRQAAIEVGLLNRDTRGVTFVLQGDTVIAKADLWAWVFSGQVFRSTLANLAGAVDALDEDLSLRVGGHTFFREAS